MDHGQLLVCSPWVCLPSGCGMWTSLLTASESCLRTSFLDDVVLTVLVTGDGHSVIDCLHSTTALSSWPCFSNTSAADFYVCSSTNFFSGYMAQLSSVNCIYMAKYYESYACVRLTEHLATLIAKLKMYHINLFLSDIFHYIATYSLKEHWSYAMHDTIDDTGQCSPQL